MKHPMIEKATAQRRKRSRADPPNLDNPSRDAAWPTVSGWCRLSSMCISATYESLSRGDLRAKKLGTRTLIDVRHGLAWIESQPDVEIKWKRAPRRSSLMRGEGARMATRDEIEALPES